MAEEGKIVRNRQTGELGIVRGGVVVPYGQGPQPVTVGRPDPSFPYEGPKAAADATNTQVNANVNAATAPAQIKKAAADAVTAERGASTAGLPEGYKWSADGTTAVPIPGYSRQGLSPETRDKALAAFNDAASISETVELLRKQFYAGPGQTTGLSGIQDYFPTATNGKFNDTGQRARGLVKRALGFTGGEGNVLAESEALYGPFLPQAGDKDERIVAKIAALEALGAKAREKAIQTLGGVPDANGNVTPISGDRPNAMTYLRTDGGSTGPMEAAGTGARMEAIPYPEEGQAEHDALVASLIRQGGGRLDVGAYVRAASELDRKYERRTDPEALAGWANEINQYLGAGGVTIPTGIQPTMQEMSFGDRVGNNIASNPRTAALAGLGDTFGIMSAIDPQAMDAIGEMNPGAMLAGQIAGAIGGTGLVGAAGRKLTSAIAPKLLQGGAKAQFGRNIAADATYGGIYGGVSEGDPVGGAALGSIGSAGGQALGRVTADAIGGIPVSDAVKALGARGIPMTTGQRMGGFFKSVEDKATSLPIVGDMIAARRAEGLDAFNDEGFREVGSMFGYTPTRAGKEGVEDLIGAPGDPRNNGAIGQFYDQKTAGVTMPLDEQWPVDWEGVVEQGGKLPEDHLARFAKALENRVNPINDAGELTGESYQQAVRGLKSYRNETTKSGFEQDYRDALGGGIDALTAQMKRGGGDSVVEGLQTADAAYRSAKILQDATKRAKGSDYKFSPFQLQGAVQKSQSKYPGATPLEKLADDGQKVLPSQYPDSGTAGRVAQMAAGGGVLGLGGGAGYALGDIEGAKDGAITSAALTALAILGGTKAGQKVINKTLFDRPQFLRDLSAKGRKPIAGLFGHAGVPIALEAGY